MSALALAFAAVADGLGLWLKLKKCQRIPFGLVSAERLSAFFELHLQFSLRSFKVRVHASSTAKQLIS